MPRAPATLLDLEPAPCGVGRLFMIFINTPLLFPRPSDTQSSTRGKWESLSFQEQLVTASLHTRDIPAVSSEPRRASRVLAERLPVSVSWATMLPARLDGGTRPGVQRPPVSRLDSSVQTLLSS